MDSSPRPLADSAPPPCPICREPVDASHTAVAVMNEHGAPGLVHPACYPAFSAQQRARGNDRFAESPLRDLPTPNRADAAHRE